MAAAKDEIVCHVCGFKNKPDAARCVSCGAKLEALAAEYTAEEEAAKANQQSGFSPLWVLVAFGIYLVLQGIFIVGLDVALAAYDPQGFWGLAISIPIFFVGGVIVGRMSPGRTFIEPAVGAVVACVPTIMYVFWITPDGEFEPSLGQAIMLGAMGVMISLFGSFLGERLQGSTRKAR
jgi:hypothetical protein